jgi:4-hydroxybenzoate polyprenyltransferase
MLRDLVKLMRPKHYVKNGLILAPLVFSGQLLVGNNIVRALLATIIFSLVASAVYIINDIQDVKKDRKHPKKKNRPIASGAVSVRQAVTLLAVILVVVAVLAIVLSLNLVSIILLAVYLAINIGYSFGLKNIPIVDIAILAAGFVIRVLYGGDVVNIDVSNWLYLTVLAGAFYVSLGKRRNEIIVNGVKSRKVNKSYTLNFLDKFMYVCLALLLTFYSLWATNSVGGGHGDLFWTIPIVILLCMTYSLHIEKEGSMGDPVDVLFGNKVLLVFAAIYIILTTFLLYI